MAKPPSLFCYVIFYFQPIIHYFWRFEKFPIKQKRPPHTWQPCKSCGNRIWTYDLRVMSPTSFQTAPSRDKCYLLKRRMGRGGFEPPKQVAADLQSVPFGHSGICPFLSAQMSWQGLIIAYHFSLCKIRFYIFYTLYFSTAAECGSSVTVILPSSTSYSFGMSE